MEKATAHYSLRKIQELLKDPDSCCVTTRAHRDAFSCGYVGKQEIIDEVLTLRSSDLSKSMTKENDHTIWQDVYKVTRDHPKHPDCRQNLYIKLQEYPTGTGVVISFHLAD